MAKNDNIKLITMDFDGTSLQKDQTWLNYRTMRALKACQAKGIYCVPCTGRTQDMFPPQIDRDLSFRYWVTVCGARIIDRLTDSIIYQETFTPEESAEVCRLFEDQHIYGEIAAAGKLYFEQDVLDELWKYSVPPHHVWYLDSGRQKGVHGKLSDFFIEEQIGIEKVNLYGLTHEQSEKISNGLLSKSYVEFKGGTPTDIQFFCKRTDKIKGVEILLKKLNLTWDNVLSIGDQMGMDSSMIERAGLGIAMGNAPEELKKIADDVTDTFDNDGFAKALEKWLL